MGPSLSYPTFCKENEQGAPHLSYPCKRMEQPAPLVPSPLRATNSEALPLPIYSKGNEQRTRLALSPSRGMNSGPPCLSTLLKGVEAADPPRCPTSFEESEQWGLPPPTLFYLP